MSDTIEPVMLDENEKQALAHRLVDQAKADGVDLLGPVSEKCCRLRPVGRSNSSSIKDH